MSDENLEQWINMKFCVKIGKSASETLSLSTVAYGEYAVKKSIFKHSSQKGEKMYKITQEVGIQKHKDRCKCGQSTNLGALTLKTR
jgi:hypothetical protein